MRIEREILLSRISARAAMPSPRLSLPSVSQETEMVQRELKHLRRQCTELSKEKESIRLDNFYISICIYSVYITSISALM